MGLDIDCPKGCVGGKDVSWYCKATPEPNITEVAVAQFESNTSEDVVYWATGQTRYYLCSSTGTGGHTQCWPVTNIPAGRYPDETIIDVNDPTANGICSTTPQNPVPNDPVPEDPYVPPWTIPPRAYDSCPTGCEYNTAFIGSSTGNGDFTGTAEYSCVASEGYSVSFYHPGTKATDPYEIHGSDPYWKYNCETKSIDGQPVSFQCTPDTTPGNLVYKSDMGLAPKLSVGDKTASCAGAAQVPLPWTRPERPHHDPHDPWRPITRPCNQPCPIKPQCRLL